MNYCLGVGWGRGSPAWEQGRCNIFVDLGKEAGEGEVPHGFPTFSSPAQTSGILGRTFCALLPNRHIFPSGCLASICPCSGRQCSRPCGRRACSLVCHGNGATVGKAFLGDRTQMWLSVGILMGLGFLCSSTDLLIHFKNSFC